MLHCFLGKRRTFHLNFDPKMASFAWQITVRGRHVKNTSVLEYFYCFHTQIYFKDSLKSKQFQPYKLSPQVSQTRSHLNTNQLLKQWWILTIKYETQMQMWIKPLWNNWFLIDLLKISQQENMRIFYNSFLLRIQKWYKITFRLRLMGWNWTVLQQK